MVLTHAQGEPLNYCRERGFVAGPRQEVPTDPHDFNWGRSGQGCSHLRCSQCKQDVVWKVKGSERHYSCQCARYAAGYLEWLGEIHYQGPAEIPVEMPPWSCAGHPARVSPGPYSGAELTELVGQGFAALDAEFHRWAGTQRPSLLALGLATRAMAAQAVACRFFRFNPTAEPALTTLVALADSGLEDAEVLKELCPALALQGEAGRSALRRLATRAESAVFAVESLEGDGEWLLDHASQLFEVNPGVAKALFKHTAFSGYQWDRRALQTLPLEVVRPQAAVMPRSGLQSGEVEVYWERDFDWLSQHYAQLCAQASDFAFYSEKFFVARGWHPDAATVDVWREQACQMNDSYNAIPHLAKYDPAWLAGNMVEVVRRSQVRGIWALDTLMQCGLPREQLRPLIPLVKALDRYEDDWDQHLRYWYP